jgi:hypothetical protein
MHITLTLGPLVSLPVGLLILQGIHLDASPVRRLMLWNTLYPLVGVWRDSVCSR